MQDASVEMTTNKTGEGVALDELHRQSEILQTIFDNIPVMINFIDPTGRVQLVNRHWEDVLGWSLDEARKSDIFTAAYPDSDYRRDVLDFVANPTPGWRNFKTRARDGREIDTSWSNVVLSDGISIGLGYDVTEQKRAEEKLRRSESQLAEAQRLAHIGSWNWDFATNTITWSDEMFRLFGLVPQETEMTHDFGFNLIHPEDQPVAQRVLDQALYEHQPYNCCLRVRHSDGTYRIIDARGQVIYDEANRPLRIFGTSQDITEQRIAEEELRSLNAVLENAVEGIARIDAEGNYISVNRAYARMLGYLPEELTSRHWRETVYHEDVKKVQVAHERLPFNPRVEFEARGLRKDGSMFWKQLVMIQTQNQLGEWTGNYCFMKDITERKLSEDVLRAYAERLRDVSQRVVEIQEAERRYLAQELHDEIGQVLSAISINLQSIAPICDAKAQPRLAESIQIVDGAIEQVRNLSLDLRPAMLDELGLVATLRWCADRLSQRAGFTLHFSADCSGRRLPTTIETACYRVAQESLTNVVRHAKANNVWVTFSDVGEQEIVELMIRDDGVGFDPVDLRQRAAHGASFGVLGMQERVELVGGELVIESTPNCGTLVAARIPAASRSAEPTEG